MKHSILIIATVAFSFFTTNATNLKSQVNTVNTVNINKDEIIEVFDWTVKTTTGEFSGTASSLFDAKRRANIVGQNAIVIEQKITNYFILKSEMKNKNSRVFFWEIKTKKGYAKGFSSSEFNAKKMMHLIAKGDLISYRIIENKKK